MDLGPKIMSLLTRVLDAFNVRASTPKETHSKLSEPTTARTHTNNKQIMSVPGDGYLFNRHLMGGNDSTAVATDSGTQYVFLPQAVFGIQQSTNESKKHLFVVPHDAHDAKGKYIYFVGAAGSNTT